jgi:hypothetical protein
MAQAVFRMRMTRAVGAELRSSLQELFGVTRWQENTG